MPEPLGELSPAQFLRRYWQKQPCLIRQAFADFDPPLDGDDLAGLACEEMAESRLVRGTVEKADWTLAHGPFCEDDFAALPEHGWTLLVQDVEKHYAPLQEMMRYFDFLPNWRLDDLMISYAARGGSVGPHVDQYDVFLLQAQGRRRWQIARAFDPELLDDCPLNVLKTFTPEQEWVLEPGDMLYLPPNVAHHGVALEPGMTWSIGARAPSAADLLQGLGEWLAFTRDEGGRYADPALEAARRAGEIDAKALRGLRDLMLAHLGDDDGLHVFLAAFMSRYRMAHEPAPPAAALRSEAVLEALENGAALVRNPWARLAWVETTGGAMLYASGQAHECSTVLAEGLCRPAAPEVSPELLDRDAAETLTRLINNGCLALIDEQGAA